MKKIFKYFIFFILGVSALFMVGPRASSVLLDPTITSRTMEDLQLHLQAEQTSDLIKPDNEAMVYWADSIGIKTDYALVYLHGFSASRGEGDPIHLEFARRYHMNAYLARLDQHGLNESDALLKLTPENLLQSAKEAIAYGKLLGNKVIVMSCSTGGTLAIYLASQNPSWVDGLICYSPNIDTYNQATHLLDGPWGKQILQLIEGGKYHGWEDSDDVKKFWSTRYRNEALIDLRQLLDATMRPETFHEVKQPFLLLYYYKSEEEQDQTVSVPAMLQMYDQLGTPPDLKAKFAVPKAGHHVLASKYHSKDLETVRKYTFDFAENVLHLSPHFGGLDE
ncbi:MAG: alpha/beta hydrolase [Saprospiraceae bacterium]|nr:alpha/beta hydrolase [Saprospiraceae bacterium]